jgi:ribosome-associated protein
MNRARLEQELDFETQLSGGAGGQHVNRTESAVVLRWSLMKSSALSENDKTWLFEKLKTRLTLAHEIVMKCESERSQFQNKRQVIERFFKLLEQALIRPKKRLATKPTRGSKERRLEGKRIKSLTKKNRKVVDD